MYELVVWPDVQEFMELDGFAEHACLANDDFFVEKYGSSAYFVDAEWLKSTQKKDEEKRLLSLADKLRKCFPEGKMPGTAYYYRCNNREIFLKLKKFFIQYGNYTDEEIIDATKRFVASFQGNYRYLPLAKYFISKNKTITDEDGKNHITEVSPLATYLENKEDAEINNSDDWLMSSRN